MKARLMLSQVFIDDCTIASMVKRLTENPQYFAVSANVVNGGAISWVHYHMGVYVSYLPASVYSAYVSSTLVADS